MKISMEAIVNIYRQAKLVYSGSLSRKEAVGQAMQFGGMSDASARDSIQNLHYMLAGRKYARTMNIEATKYFLRNIHADFGTAGFQEAVSAVKLHIEYYASLPNGGMQVTLLKEVEKLEAEFGAEVKTIFPDELPDPTRLVEGAKKTVTVNAYERSPAARRMCLERYGYGCAVCGFKFTDTYGDLGNEFIHVHHELDLAAIGEEYEVDPIEDLKPV
ncbi:HNH endonuclease [Pontiella sulfatireligans]|uniref:HNH endonuclease n=1 Tax=Pontiella sulfatireligans TaxID=2750658 RepID=A0A6C2UST7_9BACT|nr:HNH endonuclease [Pontiella sulfatireligans]VGO22314.1 hypothetical protein SCARR_04397 [Pontiella sulfatireligans]